MGKVTREELLKRIAGFLDMPGVCQPEKRPEILDVCEKLSDGQLAGIAASLRVRLRSLMSVNASKETRQAIVSTRQQLDSLAKKYALRP